MALCNPFNSAKMTLNFQIILFFLIITHTTSLTFNFSRFKPNCRCLNYQGNASVSEKAIHLTENISSISNLGRVTYCKPVYLWNKSSRNLTDFYTTFSFSIDSQNLANYGDGMTFFLSPVHFPLDNFAGGGLALARENQTSKYPFLAVEFDTFPNIWDPPYQHVGIDINSVRSNITTAWLSNIQDGKKVFASVRYESTLKRLTVTFTGFGSSNNVIEQNLSYDVDLRDYLPEWVTVGFSAATGWSSEMHTLYSWSFTSSLEENDKPKDKAPTENTPKIIDVPRNDKSTNRSNKVTGLVIGLGVGVCVFVGVILSWLYFFLWKKSREEKGNEVISNLSMDDDFEKGTGPRKFSYNDLVRATNNFSEQEKLGEGGFGAVYRGFFKELDLFVAVKRISSGSKQGIREYASEVKVISQLRHRNLVQLIGWCHEKRELLLVYELMPNGSLDSHLFKENKLLTWEMRYNIVLGLASGLLYLQEECQQLVVHRDIKSSNIMLDSNFNAKLGDFGLARLVDHNKGFQTTLLAGTLGYMAPEYVITGKASKESDVYSFGIVALEIACGKKPLNLKGNEDQISMVQWVWDLYRGGNVKLLEGADPRLNGDFDEQQLECLMVVGIWCAHPDAKLRPSIRQAIQVLNFEASLPVLPLKMPVPTYSSPVVKASSLSLSLSDHSIS